MNKRKFTATVAVVIILVMGFAGGILASGYIQWGGTQDYETSVINLDLISIRSRELFDQKEALSRENEQLTNIIRDKDNVILNKDNEIAALEKRIEGGQTAKDQLMQAEIDMADINTRTKQLLNELQ